MKTIKFYNIRPFGFKEKVYKKQIHDIINIDGSHSTYENMVPYFVKFNCLHV